MQGALECQGARWIGTVSNWLGSGCRQHSLFGGSVELKMHTVQVKRKRDQEPLQTLVVRAKRKRLDTVFRLAGTMNSHAENDIVLSSTGEGVFRLPPKDKSSIEDDIPPELKDMIDDYMSQSTKQEKEAPGDGQAQAAPVAVESPDTEVEDYVYDVYYSNSSQAAGSSSGKIGYM